MAIIIGLMSGTSADGVDAGAFQITGSGSRLSVRFLGSAKVAYGEGLRDAVIGFAPKAPVEAAMRLDVAVGKVFAKAAYALMGRLARSGLKAELIGSHGQTVHHMPEDGATLQLGSAAHIAAKTGLGVWSDFRRADMAGGGQGAPLAPVAHLAMFGHETENRLAVNIGGIANITHIPAGSTSLRGLAAFDTGPGNMLMDIAARRIIGKPYDRNGALAAGGRVDASLLKRAMSHPYFKRQPPKSTGRETFGEVFFKWLFPKGRVRWTADLAATLTELTAVSVAGEIEKLACAGRPSDRIIVCGGGAKNGYLVRRLAALCAPVPVQASKAVGIDPGQVETALMAILAYHAKCGAALDLGSITGSRHPVRLGVFTPAP